MGAGELDIVQQFGLVMHCVVVVVGGIIGLEVVGGTTTPESGQVVLYSVQTSGS